MRRRACQDAIASKPLANSLNIKCTSPTYNSYNKKHAMHRHKVASQRGQRSRLVMSAYLFLLLFDARDDWNERARVLRLIRVGHILQAVYMQLPPYFELARSNCGLGRHGR